MDDLTKLLLGTMSPAEERAFRRKFKREVDEDQGEAAKAHLAAGRPIHYYDERYPEGLVRKHPDGKLELVSIDNSGVSSIIRPL